MSGIKGIAAGMAAAAGSLGAAPALELLQAKRLGPRHLRAIAYHSVPAAAGEAFRRQLAFLAERYDCLSEDGLKAFLAGGEAGAAGSRSRGAEKPRLVISFDDGLIDNYGVAAPLLEEAGLVGWFFVPTDLPGREGAEAEAFCAAGSLRLPREPGRRPAMTWDELRDLKRRGHVIGCHTASHRRMRGKPDAELLRAEIHDSRALAARELGRAPDSFAWVGGEPDTYAAEAERAVAAAGFRFAFTTQSLPFLPGDDPLRIHRSVLEPDLPFGLFRLKLAGLSDFAHRAGRAEALARLGERTIETGDGNDRP